MSEERFSYVVERYFRERGTHPVTLMFKNQQVDDTFLLNLDETIHARFGNNDAIELITTKLVEGDYWSGILIEFNQSEFEGLDSTDFGSMQKSQTLNSQLMDVYDEFTEHDTRITGFSTGTSVYAVASLESLGKQYFKTASDVYSGPTID